MVNNPNQPQENDAVLGSQASASPGSVVLGGLESVKRRLASTVIEQRVAALPEALKYGEAGLDLVIQALTDKSERVEKAAYLLLQGRNELKANQALLNLEYLHLRTLLAAKKWKEAEQKTTAIMLNISDRKKEHSLRVEDIEKFPCEHLRAIDQLWVKHSNGRFGFSVQTHIWQSIGGTSNADWGAWCRFGELIGWYVKDSWLWWNDLNFTLNAPVGHLPRGGAFIGWGLGDFWTGCRMLSCLALKLKNCNIISNPLNPLYFQSRLVEPLKVLFLQLFSWQKH